MEKKTNGFSSSTNTDVSELASKYSKYLKNHLRINRQCFKEEVSGTFLLTKKQNTLMKKTATAQGWPDAILQFLATGSSYENLKFSNATSPQFLEKNIQKDPATLLLH